MHDLMHDVISPATDWLSCNIAA